MSFPLTAFGQTVRIASRLTVRVTYDPDVSSVRSEDCALVIPSIASVSPAVIRQRRWGVIIGTDAELPRDLSDQPVFLLSTLAYLQEGSILSIEPHTGFLRIVYRPGSFHNALFATDRCNSRCLMCSQPPKDVDDGYLMEEHFRIADLIETPPDYLGITGGEPTLLGDHLPRLLAHLKTRLPTTHIQMLTNGRAYRDPEVVSRLAEVQHPSFMSAIPLYGDVAWVHDEVVQAPGAFDETLEGLYNAAEAGLDVEIRVVLVQPTVERLKPLMEFIYWNLPFAGHVALMGLEPMGYAKKNWDRLWVEPDTFHQALEEAVQFLFWRGMSVSIYNLPLCLLPSTLWGFARQSISDFKNIYLPVCETCQLQSQCSGLFASQESRHSQAIAPIQGLGLTQANAHKAGDKAC